jgi:hypothetical protein
VDVRELLRVQLGTVGMYIDTNQAKPVAEKLSEITYSICSQVASVCHHLSDEEVDKMFDHIKGLTKELMTEYKKELIR